MGGSTNIFKLKAILKIIADSIQILILSNNLLCLQIINSGSSFQTITITSNLNSPNKITGTLK